ncbi:MAG: response regulator [Desulfuromonadales bacterium]
MNDKPRILIVGDDPVSIQLLTKSLQSEYEIHTATNGCDAVSYVKEILFDMLILDVMTPDMSGFDVCKIIKAEKIYADIPILFLTVADTIFFEFLKLVSGGIDCLEKPVNPDLLKLRVRNHIESKRRHDLVKEQRAQLEAAFARVKLFEGIIHICSYCKKIRDDQNSWHQLEAYISRHSKTLFSHGICPDCAVEQTALIDDLFPA